MPRLIVLAIAAALALPALAQEAAPHTLPFSSTGHTLELEVAHPMSNVESTTLTVRLADVPAWLTVTPAERTLDDLEPGTTTLTRFAFEAAPDAPVGEPGTMRFDITSAEGLTWSKSVRLEVSAPDDFALAAAYPNPFGAQPATIAFDVPREATVRVMVYDLLGREVMRLADDEFEPGRHTVSLDPGRLANGVYVVRLSGEDEKSERAVAYQKLTLVR